jgi:hypothetical protein
LLSVFARSDFVLEYIQILEFRVCQASQIKLVKVVQLFGLTPVGLGNYYDNLLPSKKAEKFLYPKKQINYIGAIGAIEFVHNNFGLLIAESGYISLLVFLSIGILFLKNDIKLLKKGSDYQKAFTIAFWALFTFGVFNPIIPGSYNVLFWGIRGLLI